MTLAPRCAPTPARPEVLWILDAYAGLLSSMLLLGTTPVLLILKNDENRAPFLSLLSKPGSIQSGGNLFSPNPLSTRVLRHLIVMMNPNTVSAGTPASTPISAKRIFGVADALVEDMAEDDALGCAVTEIDSRVAEEESRRWLSSVANPSEERDEPGDRCVSNDASGTMDVESGCCEMIVADGNKCATVK